jgi:serine phosphatase RsbU (regulator of sigma subunit)
VCILVFPDGGGEIEVANAGHIPPLVVHGGTATYLDPTGTLLGVEKRRDRTASIPRTPGARLVLMTDGLVERRTEPIHTTLDRLADEVADSDLDAETLCDRLMDRWGDGEDDICLMVVDLDA